MVTGRWRGLAGRQPVRPQLGLHHPEGVGLDGARNAETGPGIVEAHGDCTTRSPAACSAPVRVVVVSRMAAQGPA